MKRSEEELTALILDALKSEEENLEYIGKVIALITHKQDKLNMELSGEHYASRLITEEGKHINYGDCILSEAMEMQDSTPWKHWKAGGFNKENINTEIIDQFHFAPSVFITTMARLKIFTNLLDTVYSTSMALSTHQEDLTAVCVSEDVLYSYIKNNIITLGVNISNIYLMARINPDVLKNENTLRKLIGLSLGVIKNSLLLFMINNNITDAKAAIDEIYNQYLVKNLLNSFRNRNGYREGTYIKHWNGVEDNDVVFTIARELGADGVAIEDLETRLLEEMEKAYQNECKRVTIL